MNKIKGIVKQSFNTKLGFFVEKGESVEVSVQRNCKSIICIEYEGTGMKLETKISLNEVGKYFLFDKELKYKLNVEFLSYEGHVFGRRTFKYRDKNLLQSKLLRFYFEHSTEATIQAKLQGYEELKICIASFSKLSIIEFLLSRYERMNTHSEGTRSFISAYTSLPLGSEYTINTFKMKFRNSCCNIENYEVPAEDFGIYEGDEGASWLDMVSSFVPRIVKEKTR